MKKTFLLFVAGLFAVTASAQDPRIVDGTDFVVVKGKSAVNIREAASTKSPKVGSLPVDFTLPVIGDDNNWFQVILPDLGYGFVSPSVCKVSTAKLDASRVTDHVYGVCESYEEAVTWSVAPIKGTEWFVAVTMSDNSPLPVPGGQRLWKGYKAGNVLVFTSYVQLNANYNEGPTGLKIAKGKENGNTVVTINFGDKGAMPDNQGGKVLRPSAITGQMFDSIFDGNEADDARLYLGPELFTEKYANVVIG